MCFDLDSSPPIPVISGAAVSHDDLVLEARDGNRFAAFLATPEEPSEKGVVILPDVRGLYRFYEEVALRFAERGYTALALDYFGRTAGVEKRGEDFEYRPHVDAVSPEQIQADVAAAVEHLRSLGVESVFTVGFCMGGRQSWLAAAAGHGLAGAVGFYGRPGEAADGSAGPQQLAPQIEAPVLALQAGADAAHHRGGQRGVRARALRRGRRARARRLRGRAAQLLRPQAGRVRRRVRGRLGPRARVRRASRP